MTDTTGAAASESLRERKKRETRERLRVAANELVAAKGIADTTVEEICAAAGVSPRTFFNYFPSKNAAILGLPDGSIPDRDREAFLNGSASLIDDLVELVAGFSDGLPQDRKRAGALILKHPELVPTMYQWAEEHKGGLVSLAEQRSDPKTARLAVQLVMVAFMSVASTPRGLGRQQIVREIHRALGELRALLDASGGGDAGSDAAG
ncbi:TetR family transcriptional regulator [Humibacter ginsenosidimutans]|uniref:TetR family transcriptional regulator n=1 Tax=Humibacter ginsenosidimutans TaxID=2599293 RepID=UPI001FEDA237|nr:TetR family transcriptional regulator [Humibacter ginsenosidimutans]